MKSPNGNFSQPGLLNQARDANPPMSKQLLFGKGSSGALRGGVPCLSCAHIAAATYNILTIKDLERRTPLASDQANKPPKSTALLPYFYQRILAEGQMGPGQQVVCAAAHAPIRRPGSPYTG
jgi:hypothetical protein